MYKRLLVISMALLAAGASSCRQLSPANDETPHGPSPSPTAYSGQRADTAKSATEAKGIVGWVEPYISYVVEDGGIRPTTIAAIGVQEDADALYTRLLKHVGRLGRWQRAVNNGCAVSYLGQNQALTAAHCLGSTKPGCKAPALQIDSITWGDGTRGRVTELIDCNDADDQDWALIRVDDLVPSAPMEKELLAPGASAAIAILHYGQRKTGDTYIHGSLQFTGRCKMQPGTGTLNGILTHDCETTYGSSGGPVFSATSSRMIGIHVAGVGNANQVTLLSTMRRLNGELLFSDQ